MLSLGYYYYIRANYQHDCLGYSSSNMGAEVGLSHLLLGT